jgi:hypothetical protein
MFAKKFNKAIMLAKAVSTDGKSNFYGSSYVFLLLLFKKKKKKEGGYKPFGQFGGGVARPNGCGRATPKLAKGWS